MKGATTLHTLKTLKLASLATLLLGIGATKQAQAATFIFNFGTLVTGDPPSGSNIATMTISDTVANSVLVTLSHNASSATGQFITDLYFNLNPYVTVVPSAETPPNKFDSFSQGNGSVGTAGYDFDLRQQFQTSNSGGGVNRLKPGESVTFVLTGGGVDAADFLSFATPPNGGLNNVYAMIHLQGIPGGGSAKIAAVPEPATFAAFGIGALGLLLRRRLTKKQ